MNSFKGILKRIGKYTWYVLLFICFSAITGAVAGITWYVLTEHSYKECDETPPAHAGGIILGQAKLVLNLRVLDILYSVVSLPH